MTLARTRAYCLTCCEGRMFANWADKRADNGMTVRTGPCVVCAAPMVRILVGADIAPLGVPDVEYAVTQDVFPSGGMTYVPSRYTYVTNTEGEQDYRYVDGTYRERSLAAQPNGKRRTMLLTDVLSTVVGSVDIYGQRADGRARWEAMLSNKASAPHFDEIVSALVTEGMRLSIVLWDRYSNGERHIGNGHHRLVACILLGLERIPVILADDSDYMREDDSCDDNNAPIERNTGARALWAAMRDNMPGEASDKAAAQDNGSGERCIRCDNGCGDTRCCGYRHATHCGMYVAPMPRTSTTAADRRDARRKAVNEGQRAAGNALWMLRGEVQAAMRQAQNDAVRLRAEAEAADARAEAERIRFDVLSKLYSEACNIGNALS